MIYDLNTKNKSFLNMARHLKSKGVKRYADHLILYDEKLVGVDPYDPNLSDDLKTRIFAEVSRNPWYYYRDFVKFDNGTKEGGPFELHIGSYLIIWSHIKNINSYTVLSRQCGKTTTHLAWYAWLMLFVVKNQFIVFSLQEHTAKKTVLSKWRWFVDSLPGWMKPLVTDYNDQNSTEEKSLAKQKNKILCFGGAVNGDGADRSARSFTTSNLLMDEVAFFKFNKDFFMAAAQATNTAILNAEKNGTPYGIHFTTTPARRDKGCREGHWAYNYFQACAPFRYEILDFSKEELRDYLNNNSTKGKPNGFLRIEFNWKDCGKPRSWYDDAIRTSGNDLKKIKQELDLDWPLSDEGSIFDENEMSIIEGYSNKEVVTTLKLCDGRFYMDFYEDIYPFANYLISIDTASGFGLDSTAINIIDPIDYHIVASLNNNRIGAVELEKIIKELMTVWFTEAYLIIEAAPIAIPIIQRFTQIGDIERRMFKQMVERQAEKKLKDGTIQKETVKVWRYGVSTNSKTRPQMMDLLLVIGRDTPQVITSPLVFDDIRNLKYKNGRISAAEGSHDDSIMSYLITRWAISYTPYFRGKKMTGGHLTKDILEAGSRVGLSMDEEVVNFTRVLSIDGSVQTASGTTLNSKRKISSGKYAEMVEAKEAKQKEKSSSLNRFMGYINMGG